MRVFLGFAILSLVVACSTANKYQPATASNPKLKDEIRQTVKNNSQFLNSCYADALKEEPKLSGKMVVEWEIGEDGQVNNAKVLSSSLESESLENCVLTSVKKLTFPAPEKNQMALVSYPFVFKN
jgi:TonB family protein